MSGAERVEGAAFRVARGAGIILVGGLVARLLGMGGRVVVARAFSLHDFGLLAMGVSVAGLVQPLAAAGLAVGLPRYVGVHRARGDQGALGGAIWSALAAAAILGTVTGAALALGAPALSRAMGAPELAPLLRVFALGVPLTALVTVLLGAFRGLGRTRENVLFDAVLANVLKFALLLAVLLLGGSLVWAAAAYVAATAVELAALAVHARRALAPVVGAGRPHWATGREMLAFSTPLLASDLMGGLSRQWGPVVLGMLLSPVEAGLFSAASLFLAAISLFHGALRFLYLPVSAGMMAGEGRGQVRALYATATKAAAVVTFPLVAVLVVLPHSVLAAVFGAEYQPAAAALQILAIGQFLSVWLGPNGPSLVAAGHPRPVMWATALAALGNVGLSFVLVPRLGLAGAALAAAGAVALTNAYTSVCLYRVAGVHAFNAGYARVSVFMAAVLGVGGVLAARYPVTVPLPVLVAAGVAFAAASLGGLWLLRALDELDRGVLRRVRGMIPALRPQ